MKKLKELFSKKKESKKTSNNSLNSLLFLLVGGVLGFLIAYRTSFILFLPLYLFFFMLVYSLLFSSLPSGKIEKEEKNKRERYYHFYDRLIQYAYLDDDFPKAFEKAVDTLEISDLKDNLQEYIDNSFQGELPLAYLNTRAEASLIESIKKAPEQEEDLKPLLKEMNQRLVQYKEELFPPRGGLSPNDGAGILLVGFLFFFMASIFGQSI